MSSRTPTYIITDSTGPKIKIVRDDQRDTAVPDLKRMHRTCASPGWVVFTHVLCLKKTTTTFLLLPYSTIVAADGGHDVSRLAAALQQTQNIGGPAHAAQSVSMADAQAILEAHVDAVRGNTGNAQNVLVVCIGLEANEEARGWLRTVVQVGATIGDGFIKLNCAN